MEQQSIIKIFLSCLPGDLDEKSFEHYLRQFGRIDNLKINYRSNGLCSGYGTAQFIGSKADFNYMLEQTHFIRGRMIEVKEHVSKKRFNQRIQSLNKRRLFVNRLTFEYTDYELYSYFSRIVGVERAYMSSNYESEDGTRSGFVILYRECDVEYILEKRIIVGGRVLEICRAKMKEQYFASKELNLRKKHPMAKVIKYCFKVLENHKQKNIRLNPQTLNDTQTSIRPSVSPIQKNEMFT